MLFPDQDFLFQTESSSNQNDAMYKQTELQVSS